VSEVSARLDPTEAVEDVLADAMAQGLVSDATLAATEAQAHALWALREHVPEAQRLEGLSIKHDISVAVSRIPGFIEQAGRELRALLPGIRICCFGHVGDGNLHYNQSKPAGLDDAAFRAREDAIHAVVHGITAAMGGSISAEHGIGRLKQAAFLQAKAPIAVELMGRIKQAIDPQGLFNPGRLLPLPGPSSSS
ncbi:MAG TPA: FAD-binding oxidoreductase, partial [Ramlibacter sp.]|nr:FAD-binding oxidoreductase [Ramlibacter sp.]